MKRYSGWFCVTNFRGVIWDLFTHKKTVKWGWRRWYGGRERTQHIVLYISILLRTTVSMVSTRRGHPLYKLLSFYLKLPSMYSNPITALCPTGSITLPYIRSAHVHFVKPRNEWLTRPVSCLFEQIWNSIFAVVYIKQTNAVFSYITDVSLVFSNRQDGILITLEP